MIRKLIAGLALLAIAAAMQPTGARQAEAQGMDVQPGTSGFDFTLPDNQGNIHHLAEYTADGKIVVLEWFNSGCPFVKKYYEGSNPSMQDATAFAAAHDVVWLTINSNAAGQQGAGLNHNLEIAATWGIDSPLLLDESGAVGRMFGAQNTPQLFILSGEGVLLYNGGVDDAKLDGEVPQFNYVINALTQHLAGEEVNPAVTAHVGCTVKYGEQEPLEDEQQPRNAQGER